jgi:hypothetical protein
MTRGTFRTPAGCEVTAVTAAGMREVDRVAVDEVGLRLLQMMENAGRALAWHVRDVREDGTGVVVAVDILPALTGEDSTKWIFGLRVSSGFKYAFA